MDLSGRYYFITTNSTDNYVFNNIISRQYDMFYMLLRLYEIKTTDQTVLKQLYDKYCHDSTRGNLLKKVDTKLYQEEYLTSDEIGQYMGNLQGCVKQIKANNLMTTPKVYSFNICDKFKVFLNCSQFVRFYYDLESFYKNYLILDSIFKGYIANTDSDQHSNLRDVNKEIKEIEVTKQNNVQDTNIGEKSTAESTQPVVTFFDSLFNLSFNRVISTSMIHQIFTYYQYVKSDDIIIDSSDSTVKLTIPNIIPMDYLFNDDSFESLIHSIVKSSLNQVNLYIQKVVKSLEKCQELKDQLSEMEYKITIMSLNYLLLIYCFRIIYETHNEFFINKFKNILSDPTMQSKMVNHVMQTNELSKILAIELSGNDELIDIDNGEELDNISEKYSHLIPVDQKQFVEYVFNENTRDNYPKDFNLTQFKILDLRDINQKEMNGYDNNLVDNDAMVVMSQNENILKSELLKYNLSKKHISFPYEFLVTKYFENPSILSIKKDIAIPKTIINLFESLKDILTPSNFTKDIINTFEYYKILLRNIDGLNLLSHLDVLYIIYQIIIPYYYDMYNTTQFEDSLL